MKELTKNPWLCGWFFDFFENRGHVWKLVLWIFENLQVRINNSPSTRAEQTQGHSVCDSTYILQHAYTLKYTSGLGVADSREGEASPTRGSHLDQACQHRSNLENCSNQRHHCQRNQRSSEKERGKIWCSISWFENWQYTHYDIAIILFCW